MGQAIVYCIRCNAQLRGPDFAKGSAVKIGHKVYCLKCLPEGLLPPPPEKAAEPAPSRKRGITSVGEIPAIRNAPARSSSFVWVAGVAAGGLLVALALALVSSPAPRGPGPEAAPPPPPAAVAASPLPPAELAAREALGRLLKRIAERPADLEGQQALLEDAASRATGTSVAAEIPHERERLARRRLDQRAAELAEVERQAKGSTDDQALILLRAARGRHIDAAWLEAIDRLLLPLEPKLVPAPEPLPNVVKEPAPAATPPPFPPGWEAAMHAAAGRDYGPAQNGPDAPIVRAVAALQNDAYQALARTPRGQKLSLEAWGGRRVEGLFIRENAGILELKDDVELELGEITPASLSALLRADPKTAAAFCLIEGDVAGAKTLLGADTAALPPRFWTWAERQARASEPSPGLYGEALLALEKPVSAAEGVAKLQALLRDRADDVFVRRNRAAIAARALGGRDFLLLPEDLRGAGAFHLGKGGKMEVCWTIDQDVEPAKLKETTVEAEFSTLPETAYKAWVYAGGCCQEVFECLLEGSGLETPKPVKPYLSSLKKTHAMHNGPKQPSRWEWLPLPLPRYEKAGPQKLRLLSDQKGFSVAYLVISATRSGPPTESELKEPIRARAERPKTIPQPPKVVPIVVMKMDPSERQVTGTIRDRAVHGIPLFEHCMVGLDRPEDIALPEQGEVRFTYFLKAPSKLTMRLRIIRDGNTIPFDVALPTTVVGQPTDVRIPLSDFKPAYVKGPAAAPGELTRMFHFMAANIDCGLRIDAFSLVEIKK